MKRPHEEGLERKDETRVIFERWCLRTFQNGQEISSHRLKKCCETWEWTPWLWELLTPQTMRKSSKQQQKIVQRGSDRTDSWLSNRNVGIQKDNTMIFPKWWKENISLYSVKNIPQKWSQNNDFFSRDRKLREFIASRFRVEEMQNSLGRRKMVTNGSTEMEEGMKSHRESNCV